MSASTTSDHSALNLSVTYFGTAVTSATFPLEYLPTRSRPIPYSPLPPCLLQADLAISSLGLPIYFLIRTHTRFARPQRSAKLFMFHCNFLSVWAAGGKDYNWKKLKLCERWCV